MVQPPAQWLAAWALGEGNPGLYASPDRYQNLNQVLFLSPSQDSALVKCSNRFSHSIFNYMINITNGF